MPNSLIRRLTVLAETPSNFAMQCTGRFISNSSISLSSSMLYLGRPISRVTVWTVLWVTSSCSMWSITSLNNSCKASTISGEIFTCLDNASNRYSSCRHVNSKKSMSRGALERADSNFVMSLEIISLLRIPCWHAKQNLKDCIGKLSSLFT